MTKPFLRFFRWYCHPRLRDPIEGDLMELHREREMRLGKRRADLLFAIDVMLLFRPAMIRPAEGHQNLNHYGMFRNYLTIGWRNLLRNKGYSTINIGGLAAGMAVTILIAMWIYDELSYNRSFENYDRIGHVMVHNGDGTHPSNPIPLASELRSSFSQDIKHVALFNWPQRLAVMWRDKKFMEEGTFVEPAAAEIFSFHMIYGTRKALTEPSTVMISKSLSGKLFGDVDPVGETIKIKNILDLRVGAVYDDFPANSEFSNLNIIGSWDVLLSWQPWVKEAQDRWDNNSHKIYIELNDGVTFEEISAKIKDLKKRHLDADRLKYNPELFVQPMSNWHLYSKFKSRKMVTSDQLQFVWLYGIIGGFVLMLACINFMNLSTARSAKRSKEVGIRKTMGSLRQQLITQFLSESFITVAIATAGSIVVVFVVLPYFNEIAAKQIVFPWTNATFWLAILGFALIAGLMAGSYPALYLSSFKPVKILSQRTNPLPRKVLVVVQFTVSVSLIAGTIVVYQQIQFAKDRPVGYSREGLMKVFMLTPDLFQRYDIIRNDLLQSGAVESVAQASSPVTESWYNTGSLTWEGKPQGMESNVAINWVWGPYGKTIGWKVIEGRDFNEGVSDTSSVILNQAAVKYMGFKEPIGQMIDQRFRVIGVIEDLMMGSPYSPVVPAVFFNKKENLYAISIRLNPNRSVQSSIETITSIFQKHNPSVPFEFTFIDEDYNKKFASEVRVGKLASVFSCLAIFISLLGLFALSSFVAEQRTKEIGIRKVIGASVLQLWGMLTKSFVGLVTVSCVVAFPLSWYVLANWLTRFQYRIELSPWLFPAVTAGAFVVTLATVSFQAIRAALANPVASLKSE